MAEARVTLVQVATRAGVSKTTAGYVLSGQNERMRIAEDTRQRVLRAAAEMNYRPNVMARSLRTTVQRPIAIVSDTLATEPYSGELIEGCLSHAAKRSRLTLIAETRRDVHLQTALLDELLAEQISDFIFASVYPRTIALPPALQTANVVMANCAAEDPQAAAVLPDEVEAGRAAGTLLLERGHQEGIYLVGDRATHPYAPGQDRERGLRTSLRAAGADLAGALDCAWEPEDAYEALSRLMAAAIPPRALICMNDRVALGAYQALAEHSLAIPTDVSVIAFETSHVGAWLRPSLTGIDRQLRRIGSRAVDRLLNGHQPLRGHELIPPQLRIRHSA